jgi:hypothetical protein
VLVLKGSKHLRRALVEENGDLIHDAGGLVYKNIKIKQKHKLKFRKCPMEGMSF